MITGQSLHPRGNWEKVEAFLWGNKGGCVLRIVLTDERGDNTDISIHYNGNKKDAANLLHKFRAAIDGLPKTEKCTCKKDCEEIIIATIDNA